MNYNKKGISLIDDGTKKAITPEHLDKILTSQTQNFIQKKIQKFENCRNSLNKKIIII